MYMVNNRIQIKLKIKCMCLQNDNVLPFEQVETQFDKNPANIDIGRQFAQRNNVDNIRTLNNQKHTYDGEYYQGKVNRN